MSLKICGKYEDCEFADHGCYAQKLCFENKSKTTEGVALSGQPEFALLSAKISERDDLLKDIYNILDDIKVPTKHATAGYRKEYREWADGLRVRIRNITGI